MEMKLYSEIWENIYTNNALTRIIAAKMLDCDVRKEGHHWRNYVYEGDYGCVLCPACHILSRMCSEHEVHNFTK